MPLPPRDLSSVGGSRSGVVWQGIVQELDIQTGEVLFEWQSLDHVGLDEIYATLLQDGRPGIDYTTIFGASTDLRPIGRLTLTECATVANTHGRAA